MSLNSHIIWWSTGRFRGVARRAIQLWIYEDLFRGIYLNDFSV